MQLESGSMKRIETRDLCTQYGVWRYSVLYRSGDAAASTRGVPEAVGTIRRQLASDRLLGDATSQHYGGR